MDPPPWGVHSHTQEVATLAARTKGAIMADPLCGDLNRAVRRRGNYTLRRAPWQHAALSIWLDYTDDDDGLHRSMLIMDDLPASAVDDFETYLDEIDEETRCLVADARAEFGV